MFHHPLIGGIGVWLVIKVAALTAIFLLFFGPQQESGLAGKKVDQAFLKPVPSQVVRIELDY